MFSQSSALHVIHHRLFPFGTFYFNVMLHLHPYALQRTSVVETSCIFVRLLCVIGQVLQGTEVREVCRFRESIRSICGWGNVERESYVNHLLCLTERVAVGEYGAGVGCELGVCWFCVSCVAVGWCIVVLCDLTLRRTREG